MQNPTVEEQVQEIEVTIEHAREAVKFAEAIDRLGKNRDFQLVFKDGYMGAEAQRLTLLSGDPNITDKDRENIFVSIRSIGELHGYLRAKLMIGEQMARTITECGETIDELRASEGHDEVTE